MNQDIEKAIDTAASFLFRADDQYQLGDAVGFKLGSEEALQADIQNPLEHVLDKEAGDTSIYVSFSTGISIIGGGGAIKFTNQNKIYKVEWKIIDKLETEGIIRIYTPAQVAEIIRLNPKKKVYKQANNVRAAMEKNGEILVEGQIPGKFIVLAK